MKQFSFIVLIMVLMLFPLPSRSTGGSSNFPVPPGGFAGIFTTDHCGNNACEPDLGEGCDGSDLCVGTLNECETYCDKNCQCVPPLPPPTGTSNNQPNPTGGGQPPPGGQLPPPPSGLR